MKKYFSLGMILLLASALSVLGAEAELDIKLRVYEGTRQGTVDLPEFITSSYIQPTITASLRLGSELEKEKAQIRKVFNLADVIVLTETDLSFQGEKGDSVRHLFRLNSHAYEVYVLLKEWRAGGRFLVLVNETSNQDQAEQKKKNVLTTEMLLQGGHSAVFGFEDRTGKPYFVSFLITGPARKILPPPPPPPPPPKPPRPPADPKKIEEFESGAVKAKDAVDPPKLIHRVAPVYPEEARRAGAEDLVMLNVRANPKGDVEKVMVLKGKHEALMKAAVDAVRQWKYKPYEVDGEAKSVVFTVMVRFKLEDQAAEATEAGGDVAPPKLVKRVEPKYPEAARKDGIQGAVILYVTTDEQGRVAKVEVLKSIPALDKAAIDAVRQWQYEPYVEDGKPKPVSFSVTISFKLR